MAANRVVDTPTPKDLIAVRDVLRRGRRCVGAPIGGFEAGKGDRRLRDFIPTRNFTRTQAHINPLLAAAEPGIVARTRRH